MTRRERVIRTLQHKESDIIPYHVDFTSQEAEKYLNYTGDAGFYDKIGCHLISAQYGGWPELVYDETFRDEFGVLWDRSGADKDIGVVVNPVFSEADISLWPSPVLNEKRLQAEFEGALKGDRFTIAGIGFSMFERAWSLRGMENLMMDMVCEPRFVHELCDKICEFNLRIIKIANEYDFDGFYFGDDWGMQKGQLIGASFWRTFIKPRVKIMYEAAKKNNKFIFQHSCGDIEALFPDLIDMGLDCYQTFQPEIYDIEKVKREYGGDLTFWGGISTQRLLPYASPGEIRSECTRIMKILGKGGGYIASPTHAVPGDVPAENIEAMLDVFMNQDTYL